VSQNLQGKKMVGERPGKQKKGEESANARGVKKNMLTGKGGLIRLYKRKKNRPRKIFKEG